MPRPVLLFLLTVSLALPSTGREPAARADIVDRNGVVLATVNEKGVRHYPLGSHAAHLTGYVHAPREGGPPVGTAGLEKFFDKRLRERAEAPLQLTIDARLQRLAWDTLNAWRMQGAIVIQDPTNGHLLALASWPSYDPNHLAVGMEMRTFWKLNRGKERPFLDRTTLPVSPGSVARLIPALAAARAGLARHEFFCTNSVEFDGKLLKDWDQTRNEMLTLSPALAKSANTYFYQMAAKLGPKRFDTMVRLLGIENDPVLPLPGLRRGVWLDDRSRERAEFWPIHLALASIGQGTTEISPVGISSLTSAVASGSSRSPVLLLEEEPARVLDLATVGLDAAALEDVRQGLREAVHAPGGTASRARARGIEVAGITGTAQTMHDGKKSANAWFTGYAPIDAPKYTVTVLGQRYGGSGGRDAAPRAKRIFEALVTR